MALPFLIFFFFYFILSLSLYFFFTPHLLRSLIYTRIHTHTHTPARVHHIHQHTHTHTRTQLPVSSAPSSVSFVELYYKALGEYLHTRAYASVWRGGMTDGKGGGGIWRRKEGRKTNRRRGALKQKLEAAAAVVVVVGASGKNNLIGFKNYWFLHFLKVQLMASARRPHCHTRFLKVYFDVYIHFLYSPLYFLPTAAVVVVVVLLFRNVLFIN